MEPLAEFRSIETVDPTTLTVYPDRIVLASGEDATRILALADLAGVKVRTLLGVSTVLLRTAGGGTVVADLFPPSQARQAKDLLEDLLEAGAPDGGQAVA